MVFYPVRCFYHPDYYLPLPAGHPFPMEKFPEAYEMLRRERPDTVFEFIEPATRRQLQRVHTAPYLDGIRDGTLTPKERKRLGLPHHAWLLERSAMETAGTVAAAWAALAEGIAANLAGGTHHAFEDRGEGYCVLNDVCVALADLRAAETNLHVLIIDTDAHQGNGTHALLRNDAWAFTYSIHVGKNYPSKKEEGDVDVPLERWAAGDQYLSALAQTLPETIERCEPDLAFWITGADPHEEDRFGQMRLSDADFAERDRFILEHLRRDNIPVAVLYGGGYHRGGRTGELHAQSIMRAADWLEAEKTPTAAAAS